MANKTIKPFKQQAEWIEDVLSGDIHESLYGGARGGGKTWALTVLIREWAKKYPGSTIMLVAQNYNAIETNFMAQFKDNFGSTEGTEWSWNKSTNIIQFLEPYVIKDEHGRILDEGKQGATLIMTYAGTFRQFKDNHQGKNIQLMAIEEAGNHDPEIIKFAITCLRTKVKPGEKKIVPEVLAMTSNPGGPCQYYFNRKYVRPTNNGKNLIINKTVDDAGRKAKRVLQYLPSSLRDNPYLTAEYEQSIRDSMSPELAEAYIHGDWDAVEGGFFKSFVPFHHVIDTVDIPKEWPKIVSMDWAEGGDDCAIIFSAINPYTKQKVIYDALTYRKGLKGKNDPDYIIFNSADAHTSQVAEGIIKHFGSIYEMRQQVRLFIAGDDIFNGKQPWTQTPTGKLIGTSIADLFSQMGIPWQKAEFNRIRRKQGWDMVKEMLVVDVNPVTKEKKPRMVILNKPEMEGLITDLQSAQASVTNPNDISEKGYDMADCIRYSIVGYNTKPMEINSLNKEIIDVRMAKQKEIQDINSNIRKRLGLKPLTKNKCNMLRNKKSFKIKEK